MLKRYIKLSLGGFGIGNAAVGVSDKLWWIFKDRLFSFKNLKS